MDASHGYERTHIDALDAVARLAVAYARSNLVYQKQKKSLGSIQEFPETRRTEVPITQLEQTDSVAQVPPADT